MRIHPALRLLLRLTLAIAMIHWRIVKIIPVRFPPPELSTYLLRVGELSPFQMLSTFLGYSPAYQRFTGLAELLGGVLLLFRRTTLLGALITAANLVWPAPSRSSTARRGRSRRCCSCSPP